MSSFFCFSVCAAKASAFIFLHVENEIIARNTLFLSIMLHNTFFIDHTEFLMALYVLKRIKLLYVFGLRLSF